MLRRRGNPGELLYLKIFDRRNEAGAEDKPDAHGSECRQNTSEGDVFEDVEKCYIVGQR